MHAYTHAHTSIPGVAAGSAGVASGAGGARPVNGSEYCEPMLACMPDIIWPIIAPMGVASTVAGKPVMSAQPGCMVTYGINDSTGKVNHTRPRHMEHVLPLWHGPKACAKGLAQPQA